MNFIVWLSLFKKKRHWWNIKNNETLKRAVIKGKILKIKYETAEKWNIKKTEVKSVKMMDVKIKQELKDYVWVVIFKRRENK